MAVDPKRLSRTQRTIQAALKTAEMEKKRHMTKARIDIARKGVAAFDQHKVVEAAISFKTYIRILEEIKNVNENGLHPGLFDKQKEMVELLLVNGVYWDLAKLYDKTVTTEKRREFLYYLEKFVAFSHGMPFQHMAAETLRKYIQNKNPIHKEDFKNAYKVIGKSKCYVATALLDVSEADTLVRLRAFRDERLEKSAAGKVLIRIYYKTGPFAARLTDFLPEVGRQWLGRRLDWLAKALSKS